MFLHIWQEDVEVHSKMRDLILFICIIACYNVWERLTLVPIISIWGNNGLLEFLSDHIFFKCRRLHISQGLIWGYIQMHTTKSFRNLISSSMMYSTLKRRQILHKNVLLGSLAFDIMIFHQISLTSDTLILRICKSQILNKASCIGSWCPSDLPPS